MEYNETVQRVLTHLLASVKPEHLSERGAEIMEQIETATAADLGMNSVEAVAFLKRVGDEFGVEIPLDQASNWKTISDLTNYLEG